MTDNPADKAETLDDLIERAKRAIKDARDLMEKTGEPAEPETEQGRDKPPA
jgi:hypothetical protein